MASMVSLCAATSPSSSASAAATTTSVTVDVMKNSSCQDDVLESSVSITTTSSHDHPNHVVGNAQSTTSVLVSSSSSSSSENAAATDISTVKGVGGGDEDDDNNNDNEADETTVELALVTTTASSSSCVNRSRSGSSNYTTPKRPAGLAAVTPGTSLSITTTASSSSITKDEFVQPSKDVRAVVTTHAVASSSSGEGGGGMDPVEVIVEEAEVSRLQDDEKVRNSPAVDTNTATTTDATLSTLVESDLGENTTSSSSNPLAAAGPQVTPAPTTSLPPPTATTEREEESGLLSLSSLASVSQSDSPFKPRNLDGVLSTRESRDSTTSTTRTSATRRDKALAPPTILLSMDEECPSTPGGATQPSPSFKNPLHSPATCFLAAKISPLRSSSARRNEEKNKNISNNKKKKNSVLGTRNSATSSSSETTAADKFIVKREKTPPPSSSIMEDPVNLSPGIFLCTPKPTGKHHDQEHRSGGDGGSRPSSLIPGLTPTNFASDFGKGGNRNEDSLNAMDANNVFAWLHSPSGEGLFSPNGGLNSLSVTNTPRGMYGFTGSTAIAGNRVGITPKLALSSSTGSTTHPSSSLSSSENQNCYYAELEAGFDAGVNTPKIPESQQSMICISPLSSKKSGKNKNESASGVSAPDTPMSINFSEVFASPRLPTPRLSRMGRPTSGGFDVPALRTDDDGVGSSSDEHQSSPVATALHAAERGINVDDDLNALLQLAESTTPGGQPTMAFMSPLLTNSLRRVTVAPPSSLQFPIISGSSTTSSGRGGGINMSPPQLAIRSSSSSGMLQGSGSSIKVSSLKKKIPKTKFSDTLSSKPGHQHHGQLKPSPGGYHHSSLAPNQYVSSAHPANLEATAANPRYYPPPAYTSQGYVYSSTRDFSHMDNYTLTSSISSKDPSLAKSSQRAILSAQSRLKSKPKISPVIKKDGKKTSTTETPPSTSTPAKRIRKASSKSSASTPANVGSAKKAKTTYSDPADKDRIAAAIIAVNNVYGDGSEKERKLKEVTLRGVTQRPSRKWQAQLYYAGKSRYIGVFDSKEKASLAYEIAREVLKTDKDDQGPINAEETERDVNLARKAAFAGVNELADN